MFEVLAFSYGLLTSFVLAGVERNHRARRAHPPVLVYAGYALCGSLGTAALVGLAWAAGTTAGLI